MVENNRVKRIGAFMVCLSWALCLFCFIAFQTPVKVEAAEEDTYWIDVLQYGGIRQPGEQYGSTTRFVTNPETRLFRLALPYVLSYSYIDMIIYTGGGYPPTDLKFRIEQNYLNVVKWGQYGEYWRCYGPVNLTWGQSENVLLYVETSWQDNIYMNIMQCRISDTQPYTDVPATWSIYQDSHTESGSFPGAATSADWASASEEAGNLRVQISHSEWLKYEHIDLMLLFDVAHIDGITACLVSDEGYIPISYQYLNNDDYPDAFNMISISLDLNNVKATQSDLRIYITFHSGKTSYNNFHLYSIHGWSGTSFISGDAYWFPRLINAIKEGFSNMYDTPQGATPPSASNDVINSQTNIQNGIGSIEQDLNVIATVPRPDLGSIDMPSSKLEDIDYNNNVAHLTMLTHSQPFRLIFFFAALFMVVGTVLYGRRG